VSRPGVLALCLALAAAGLRADPPAVVMAEPLPGWDAKFRRSDGWVGADGAYSVPVGETRTVWLFSDTWVGSVRGGKRTGVVLVNNTIGVQDGHGDAAKVTFAIKRDAAGKPSAIFVPPDGRGFFWPHAGLCLDGTLYVFLIQVEHTKGSGAFAFKLVGQWLGAVENPGDDPTAWKVSYSKLPFAEFAAGRTVSFGAAVLRAGDQVYVYGFEERPGKPFRVKRMVLARVPADKLADFEAWRFYTGGEWKADAKELTALAGGLAAEFSVSYVPGLKKFAAVYTELGLSDRIVGRFADAPEGPWSDPVLLYRCPEMKRDKKVFTYAAKAHPHLSGERDLVISYCTNSFDLAPVINDATLYWPTFVRVALK
jgi:hypothetical protein